MALPATTSTMAVLDRPVLELLDIRVSYDSRASRDAIVAIAGVSLTVSPGEFVAVAGRSGSGKTTLLNVAAGLQVPTAGRVLWREEDLNGASMDEVTRRRGRMIGIVFQTGALIETLTAAENVAIAAMPSKLREGRRRSLELLAELGLSERANHFPAQLSGGEQQRVALARALFADPELLIVDEPTANLDRRAADDVIELLLKLTGTRRALLVASHDRALLARADRVVEMEAS